MLRFTEANKQDIPGIIGVMKNTGYARFVYSGKSDDQIEKDILASSNTYLVCFEKRLFKPKKIVGYFIFTRMKDQLGDAKDHVVIDKRYAYHSGVGVHSDYRRMNIGKKLTLYALKKAKQQGFRGMYADVGSNNDSSIRLQEAVGFEKIADYPSKKRGTHNNVVFVKHF